MRTVVNCEYLQAKRNVKHKVYTVKKTAEVNKLSDLKPGMNDIFKISKQLTTRPRKLLGKTTMSIFLMKSSLGILMT